MRSKEQLLQSERALATSEAWLSLYQLQQKASEAAFEQFEAKLGAAFEQLRLVHDKLTVVSEKLDTLHEQAGVPQRDIPTIDELLDEARTDPVRRKLLQNTLAELEFENTEVDFN